MVIECENISSLTTQKQHSDENKDTDIHENMDKESYVDTEIKKNVENGETSSQDYETETSNNELLRISSNSNWWSSDQEGGKLDSRQRWSFGSDISIEAAENVQNRLCCSPVDEFDSTVSSENEDLIVNSTEERDESYKNYIQVSPVCSPTFNKAMCSSSSKKQNKNHDVDTADDELIDYSKRYTTDSSMLIVENKHIASSHIQQKRRNVIVNTVTRHVPEKKSSANNRSKVDPFGDYAETDLDQPTDYSLRYAEEDTDEEEKEEPQFYCTGGQEDTVKTYYTEGTPYQTPCNFSTATSMSDLLSLEDIKEGDDVVYKRQFLREQKQETNENSEKAVKDCRNRIRRKYFSEDSKIPVLDESQEIDDQNTCEKNVEKLCTPPQSPAELCDKDKESKSVSFNTEDNDAQETPLMFSRSSSLDSLNEFDQHSIHDDHNSVISEFSHRTSGVVSPSELPDSPTQTVPPSPRKLNQQSFHNEQQQLHTLQQNQQQQYQHRHQQHQQPQPQPHPQRVPLRALERKPLNPGHQVDSKIELIGCHPSNRTAEQGSIFEDGLVSFTEESIPNKMHSTTASSLSSLTIDDEDGECDNHEIINRIAALKVRTSAAGMHQAPTQKQYRDDSSNELSKPSRQPQLNKILNRHTGYRNNYLLVPAIKEEVHFVNVDKDNNDYMNAYVNNEVHNNRYRDALKDPWYREDLKSDNRNYSNRVTPSRSPVSKRNQQRCSPQKIDVDEIITMDTIKIYCTEDTPTYVSPYGSQSNLSALSMLSISDDNLSDYGNFQLQDEPRPVYEDERPRSRVDAYDTDASSDFSEDADRCYDDGSPIERRRIDVSPFDSQINLAGFSLLRIQEESEGEDVEEEDERREYKQEENDKTNETDQSARDDSCAEDVNSYKRLSYENSDYSDEDRQVLEDYIKSGLLRLNQRTDAANVDESDLL